MVVRGMGVNHRCTGCGETLSREDRYLCISEELIDVRTAEAETDEQVLCIDCGRARFEDDRLRV